MFPKGESSSKFIEDVVRGEQMDNLFIDYYRHRDNSILQLVILLFSNAKVFNNTVATTTKDNAQVETSNNGNASLRFR